MSAREEQEAELNEADIVWVVVPLSVAEYRRFRNASHLTPDGTVWQALREAMSLQHKPIRFKSGRHIGRHMGPRPWVKES